ncbi:MAG TPA: glycosyltransferase 87 family protein [Kineosporiaceae bacterium]|nr:glycosyltransferase 87 family protein [Kineosporiaceae bacterium]
MSVDSNRSQAWYRPDWWRLLGMLLLLISAFPVAWHYLVTQSGEIWQVDLQVYREGARALVTGFPLYDLRTDQPQFLPFTYPPFAAFTALPLLLASFEVIGWVWTALQFALLWYIVGVAFRPLLARFGARAGLAHGVVAASGVWLLPVTEGVRFGQVNALVVALCLWDLTRRTGAEQTTEAGTQHRWVGGSGIPVALAAAVKLTPGVFWLHWAVARRWRILAISLTTAVLVTVGSALLLPPASATFWTDALLDPERLGPNAGTSNQSLRGVLLRLGPEPGPLASGLWLGCVLLILIAGLALARSFDRLGEPVAVVATIGMVAFLISPVSWVHHMHWGVVVIGALLGDGRDRRRIAAALTAAALLWMRLPWWGANLVADHDVPRVIARVVQNSYSWWAVLSLLGLWLLFARPAQRSADAPS